MKLWCEFCQKKLKSIIAFGYYRCNKCNYAITEDKDLKLEEHKEVKLNKD